MKSYIRYHVTRNKEQGFTLVEMIVVIALVASLSIVITGMFISQNRIYQTQNAELDVTSQVRGSLDDIDNYVRQSDQVLSTYTTPSSVTYNSGPQVLILQIQAINSSNQLVAGAYDHVVYYLNGTSLIREVFPDASSTRIAVSKNLGQSISSLAFTYNNADFSLVSKVATNLTASEASSAGTRSFTADTSSILRDF